MWILLVVMVVPGFMYVFGRAKNPGAWGLVFRGYEKPTASAYRSAPKPVWEKGRPPIVVHVAALSSFILGQMVVPGALAALAGLIASLEVLTKSSPHSEIVIPILTLSAPTGLFIAGRLLGTGLALIQRDAGAAASARKLARFSIAHNVILMAALGVSQLVGRQVESAFLLFVYPTISIIQAVIVHRAARALDERDAQEERDREAAPMPVAVEAESAAGYLPDGYIPRT